MTSWIMTAFIAWVTFLVGSALSAVLLKRKVKAYIKANSVLYQEIINKLTAQLNELEQVNEVTPSLNSAVNADIAFENAKESI